MEPTSTQRTVSLLRRARPGNESGATIVEMSVVFVLFLVLTFGIIEYSWMLAEWNEVRHVAGECARNTSVGDPPEDCSATAVAVGASCVISTGSALPTGQTGSVTVTKDYDGITGWFPVAGTLTATHPFFIEEGQPPGAGPC